MMPEKDGIEMTRELRADMTTSHIPIINGHIDMHQAIPIETLQFLTLHQQIFHTGLQIGSTERNWWN